MKFNLNPDVCMLFAKWLLVGGLCGVVTTIATIVMIRCLARRTRQYRMNYMPVTLVDSKLVQCALWVYPSLLGVIFAILCGLKLLH
jgi:uncharacterized membrane protein